MILSYLKFNIIRIHTNESQSKQQPKNYKIFSDIECSNRLELIDLDRFLYHKKDGGARTSFEKHGCN